MNLRVRRVTCESDMVAAERESVKRGDRQLYKALMDVL